MVATAIIVFIVLWAGNNVALFRGQAGDEECSTFSFRFLYSTLPGPTGPAFEEGKQVWSRIAIRVIGCVAGLIGRTIRGNAMIGGTMAGAGIATGQSAADCRTIHPTEKGGR